MRVDEFIAICEDRCIDPRVALENDAVRRHIKENGKDASVQNALVLEAILDCEF